MGLWRHVRVSLETDSRLTTPSSRFLFPPPLWTRGSRPRGRLLSRARDVASRVIALNVQYGGARYAHLALVTPLRFSDRHADVYTNLRAGPHVPAQASRTALAAMMKLDPSSLGAYGGGKPFSPFEPLQPERLDLPELAGQTVASRLVPEVLRPSNFVIVPRLAWWVQDWTQADRERALRPLIYAEAQALASGAPSVTDYNKRAEAIFSLLSWSPASGPAFLQDLEDIIVGDSPLPPSGL